MRDKLNLRKKKQVCLHSLALYVHMKSVVEQGFFHKFACDNKLLTFVKFQICQKTFVQSSNIVEFEFKLRHISDS